MLCDVSDGVGDVTFALFAGTSSVAGVPASSQQAVACADVVQCNGGAGGVAAEEEAVRRNREAFFARAAKKKPSDRWSLVGLVPMVLC